MTPITKTVWTLIVAVLLTAPVAPVFALCINRDKANLRAGPGTKYQKTWQVHKYTPLQKVGKKGNWIKVKDLDGDIHWVAASLLTSKFLCGTIKPKGGANVRTAPSTKAKKIMKIPKYSSFRLVKRSKGWVKLQDVEGNPFWVFGKLVWVQ